MSQADIDVHYVPPHGVPNWLPAILGHIEECNSGAEQAYSESEQTELLLSGRVSLWIAHCNGSLVGHTGTSIYRNGGENYIHLSHMWTKPGSGQVIESFMEPVLEYARSVNAKGVTYKTARNARAFARRAKKFGMKPSLIEFFMEVPDAN